MKTLAFVITAEVSGLRLDKALTTLPEVGSRSQAARLIEQGRVLHQQKALKPAHITILGECYQIHLPDAEPTHLEPYPIDLEIVHEDADLLVVHKPSGLVVHPAAGHAKDTLVNALIHHRPELLSGMDNLRPGIVHRLDKETSGLLVIAKNLKSLEHLAAQFRARSVHRLYFAVVFGLVRLDQGSIESHLRRHPTDRKRFASEKLNPGQSPKGKWARTRFWRIKTHPSGLTLLHCRLDSGRTHQIRIHLSELGHPIVGDSLYGGRTRTSALKNSTLRDLIQNLTRLGLHATELGFTHPRSGEKMSFSAPWPQDFRPVLDHLGWS